MNCRHHSGKTVLPERIPSRPNSNFGNISRVRSFYLFFARLLHLGTQTLKAWEIARRAVPEYVYRLAELARDTPAAPKHMEATAVNLDPARKAVRRPGAGVDKIVSVITKKRAVR